MHPKSFSQECVNEVFTSCPITGAGFSSPARAVTLQGQTCGLAVDAAASGCTLAASGCGRTVLPDHPRAAALPRHLVRSCSGRSSQGTAGGIKRPARMRERSTYSSRPGSFCSTMVCTSIDGWRYPVVARGARQMVGVCSKVRTLIPSFRSSSFRYSLSSAGRLWGCSGVAVARLCKRRRRGILRQPPDGARRRYRSSGAVIGGLFLARTGVKSSS